jgi:hypothetical protein
MSRVPQIWTNTDKEGKGTTYLPVVDAEGNTVTTQAFVDSETTLNWVGGNLTTIVKVVGTQTKTTTFGYNGSEITDIDTVIT